MRVRVEAGEQAARPARVDEAACGPRSRHGPLAGIGVLAGCWLWVGCGGPPAGQGAGSAPARLEERTAVAPESVRVLPATGAQVLQAVRDSGARAVLVNIWATWCVPCREEFPHLLRLRREYAGRGLEVILVSGDFETELPQVVGFLAEQGVDFPSYIKSGKDMDFINALDPRWTGALPASFVYDSSGALRHFWERGATYGILEEKVLDVLNTHSGPHSEEGSW